MLRDVLGLGKDLANKPVDIESWAIFDHWFLFYTFFSKVPDLLNLLHSFILPQKILNLLRGSVKKSLWLGFHLKQLIYYQFPKTFFSSPLNPVQNSDGQQFKNVISEVMSTKLPLNIIYTSGH